METSRRYRRATSVFRRIFFSFSEVSGTVRFWLFASTLGCWGRMSAGGCVSRVKKHQRTAARQSPEIPSRYKETVTWTERRFWVCHATLTLPRMVMNGLSALVHLSQQGIFFFFFLKGRTSSFLTLSCERKRPAALAGLHRRTPLPPTLCITY